MTGMQVDSEFDLGALKCMVEEIYGLKNIALKRLNSYDDQTFHVTLGTNQSKHLGYILKITNPTDSAVDGLLEGQIALVNHVLSKHTVKAPEAVIRKDGLLWKKEYIKEINAHLPLRMTAFHPGKLFSLCTTVDSGLLYDLGATVAKLHIAMSDFHHPVFDKYKTLWSLERCLDSQSKVSYLPDDNEKILANEVYDEFRRAIIPNLDKFKKSQLHGDINENNILVVDGPSGGLRVGTVLDWGDTHYSCILFDIAITVAYMLIYVKNMDLNEIGYHILNGYRAHKQIPDLEFDALLTCIKARLAQSVVLGYYTYQCNPVPQNEYVLITQERGWPVMRHLHTTDKNQLLNSWKR